MEAILDLTLSFALMFVHVKEETANISKSAICVLAQVANANDLTLAGLDKLDSRLLFNVLEWSDVASVRAGATVCSFFVKRKVAYSYSFKGGKGLLRVRLEGGATVGM